jgi:hypothetical protein
MTDRISTLSPVSAVAVIVTYNRLEQLKLTWQETARQDFSEIIIVNNHASDGTASWLATLADPRLSVLQTGSNLGGAGGFRFALDWLAERRSDNDTNPNTWLVFYDDDANPAGELVAELDVACKHFPEADLFAASVVNSQGEALPMNDVLGKAPESFVDQIRYPFQRYRFIRKVANGAQPAVACSFVGCIVKFDIACRYRSFLQANLFIYFDDVLFTHSLVKAGCKIIYYPDICFVHRVSVSSKGISPAWKLYFYSRNMWPLYRLYSPRWFWIPAGLRIAGSILSVLLRKKRAWQNLKLIFSGVIDGLKNNFDKTLGDIVDEHAAILDKRK